MTRFLSLIGLMRNDKLGAPPSDRATHEPSRSVSALRVGIAGALAMFLVACDQPDDAQLTWLSAPNDPQVRNYVFEQCLRLSKGPTKAHYNDWDEAIQACARTAASQSTYCPEGRDCRSDISSRADIRSMLPAQGTSGSAQDAQRLDPKGAGPVGKADAPKKDPNHDQR